MKKTKKTVSLLLCVMLIFSFLVPTFGALAADSDTAQYNGHTYKRFDESMSWKDAKAYCESIGGYLATITSSA